MAQAVTALCFILFYSLDVLKQKSIKYINTISGKLTELGEIQVAAVGCAGCNKSAMAE